MLLGSSVSSPLSSNAIARQRDERVCWLLEMHPVTAAMLVALGWFPSRNKALKRLRRLRVKQRIRLAGTVCFKAGRPEYVYCRWRPKVDQLEHEVELTELCLRLDADSILRGPNVRTKHLHPDAEIWINGRLHYLELDRGTMGYRQIQRRFEEYARQGQCVLWVCSTTGRLDGLRQRAESLRGIALFTTFAAAMSDPHAEIWMDFNGGSTALSRSSRHV